MNRRNLLQLGLTQLAWISPAFASLQTSRPVMNVRANGARGDGVHDDTSAFQGAIDALRGPGGIVEVPVGRYLLDPLHSVRLHSGVHLRMARGARLLAKPNEAERAYVLLVQGARNVEISGGEIIGERDAHLGTTGEWGHGLAIRGSFNVWVHDIRISQCWGDGISIGTTGRGEGVPSSDVLLERVTCHGNRRQGLTIGGSRRVRVIDCVFSETRGTKPEYGIDIEPDYPTRTDDVLIEGCVVRGNRGGGIQAFRRVSDVRIRDCTIEGNGYGVFIQEAVGGELSGNRIIRNRHAGVALRKGAANYRVEQNQFVANGPRAANRSSSASAVAPSRSNQIQVAPDASGITMSRNRFES